MQAITCRPFLSIMIRCWMLILSDSARPCTFRIHLVVCNHQEGKFVTVSVFSMVRYSERSTYSVAAFTKVLGSYSAGVQVGFLGHVNGYTTTRCQRLRLQYVGFPLSIVHINIRTKQSLQQSNPSQHVSGTDCVQHETHVGATRPFCNWDPFPLREDMSTLWAILIYVVSKSTWCCMRKYTWTSSTQSRGTGRRISWLTITSYIVCWFTFTWGVASVDHFKTAVFTTSNTHVIESLAIN